MKMNMTQSSCANAPMRPIDFAPVDVICEPSADDSLRLSSRTQLGSYDSSLANLFRSAVDREAGRVFLAERIGEGWRKITYEQARLVVDALAAALIERGADPHSAGILPPAERVPSAPCSGRDLPLLDRGHFD